MVFLLGRMGNTKEALDLIVNQLRDMQHAISFVQEHQKSDDDDELWDHLIHWSLNSVRQKCTHRCLLDHFMLLLGRFCLCIA